MELPTLDKFPKRVLAKIDIQRAFIVSRLIIAAERLQLFRALHDKSMTAAAIGKSLKIHELYLLPFLNTMVSLGLLHKQNDLYRNTQFAEKYFIAERSIYWTRQYSKECVSAYERLTVLEQALASGKRHYQIKGLAQPDYLERMKRDPREAEDFTQMLFYLHQGDAEALAGYLDLSQHRKVLDVAGGSGCDVDCAGRRRTRTCRLAFSTLHRFAELQPGTCAAQNCPAESARKRETYTGGFPPATT